MKKILAGFVDPEIIAMPYAQNASRVLRYALTVFPYGFRTLPSEDPTRRPSDPRRGWADSY